METIFTKIIKKEIPSVQLYEDDQAIVILDIAPVSAGHALIISKEPYPTIDQCPNDLLAHLMAIVKQVDIKLKEKLKADATNIVINNGKAAGQEVPHLHIHVIPRYIDDKKNLTFAKESYKEKEMERVGKLLQLETIVE